MTGKLLVQFVLPQLGDIDVNGMWSSKRCHMTYNYCLRRHLVVYSLVLVIKILIEEQFTRCAAIPYISPSYLILWFNKKATIKKITVLYVNHFLCYCWDTLQLFWMISRSPRNYDQLFSYLRILEFFLCSKWR